jgi:spore coat-associated protein N
MIKSLFATTAKSVGSIGLKVVIVSAATVGGAALVSSSVFASLTATAFNATAHSVTSGTLILTQAPSGVSGLTGGFSTAVTALAPGDTINRYVNVTNGGTLAGSSMTLKVADSAATLLTTDAVKGLQVTVKECTVAYTTVTGACSGTEATVLAATPANTLLTPQSVTFVNGYSASGVTNTRFIITMPTGTEVTSNGTLPGSTIQGLTSLLTWTFTETQRTGTTTFG